MRLPAALLRYTLSLALACSTVACGGVPPSGATPAAADPVVDSVPGDPAFDPEVRQRLAQALAARGAGYQPRTHHFHPDGSPKYTNRLILESSPYLLQHAHNPVNWYAWGDEAFEAARRMGRPVLLSIGYSTCHWCHVMEEESFEDEEIAGYMNANYIAIKVDREERPDIDAIYMSAVQMLTGRGGWPMTTWLTPDREPFFGGTYFPARDGDRGARTGFLTLLRQLKQTYDEQPDQVARRALETTKKIQLRMQPASHGALPRLDVVTAAVKGYQRNFDSTHGGLARAPKFPSSLPVRLLLRQYRRTGDQAVLDMATLTLEKMAAGGMYDHVGGGFHRYSTDARWLVPHFEKMLYDNALLTVAYLEGHQLTGRDDFARVAEHVLRYVGREMTSPDGGFYSATDADSLNPEGEMEEGWFFTWTPAEIEAVLGPENARLFRAYYGVTARGNFEDRNILHVTRPVDEVARQLQLPGERLRSSLAAAREKLYQARLKRPAPLRDDKILTAWNGLMISAFAQAGFVLDEPEFIAQARRAASFVLNRLREDGRLLRSFKDGQARHNAYLDDYAFLIAGLLDLYEATSEFSWLTEAITLQTTLDEHYQDNAGGGYFMTSNDHEALLARQKPSRDGAEPSGNSVALMNLVRLHEFTLDDRYRVQVEKLFRAFAQTISGSSEMLLALDFYLDTPKEVVIVTAADRREAEPFLAVLRRSYLPNKVLAVVAEGSDLATQSTVIPLVRNKIASKGKTTAYVCERGVCKLPTTDVSVFAEQLQVVRTQ